MAVGTEKKDAIYITKEDEYLFAEGTHYEIYRKMGAHKIVANGVSGVYFAVWAPNAKYVHVAGTFNNWDPYANELERLGPGGIYAAFVPSANLSDVYKYVITTHAGEKLYKADPFANYAELRPANASIVTDITTFAWSDSTWMNARKKKNHQKEPMAVYECHIGSWRKPTDDPDSFYTYREFADQIVGYLKEMKYTHIELMGIAEHPFDGSWGYQVTGYFAPTSRYGTPEDFMYLVNTLHKNKIGVILDWVPAHFPRDAFGLAQFDGTCVFEHPDPRRGEHPDWGTKIFHYGKTEVKNFLISNAVFWIKEFHIDGLRVDAVASMLYLDYGKSHGQWLPNEHGGNKNYDAIKFIKHMNSVIRHDYPGVLMIAEESTAWPKVTAPVEEDGLGFHFKWNMGWMHDFCEYMKLDPLFRKDNHYSMTFAMSYNQAENYVLPISHDEVVHLKCSMLQKMPGFYVDKFANLRAGYAYMFSHSGKKLLFMGQDFGQDEEWNEAKELSWELLEDPLHMGMQTYMKKMLEIYRKYACLYEIDNSWDGFEWMDADDTKNSIYSYVRKAENGKNNILVILNMTPMERKDYKIAVPNAGKYKLLLNSSDTQFGGTGYPAPKEVTSQKEACHGKDYSISVDLAPYAALFFVF